MDWNIDLDRIGSLRPRAGIEVDSSREVPLWRELPSPCVSIPMGDVVILLAREQLALLAEPPRAPPPWERDVSLSRARDFRSVRAHNVLATLAEAPDARGCATLSHEPNAEDKYLLVDLLENGCAAVLDARSGAAAAEVTVRYVGWRLGPLYGRGQIEVGLPGRHAFMTSMWWVS